MTDLILHHFEQSPFSEKIRVILGFKRLAWKSCLVPRILPKPDLMPLTGGYRRTPVLQIGADIFCDTQMIVREIERQHPQPTLLPPPLGPRAAGALPLSLAMWSDRPFFQTAVSLIFGALGDKVPKEFVEDRSKMRGAPFDLAAMQAAMPHLRDQFRAHGAAIDTQLDDGTTEGREWLLGAFSLADVNAYMCLWYLRFNLPEETALTQGFDRLLAWEARVKAIGHGTRTEISGVEALDVAKAAQPAATPDSTAADLRGLKAGDAVEVAAEDYGKDPVRGTLASISAQHVAVRRHDPRVGEVVVWFPRVGFAVSPG